MKTLTKRSITTAAGAYTNVATNVGDVVLVANVVDATFSLAPQQVSVGNFPDNNPNFSRAMRLSTDAVFCLRAASNGVAFLMDMLKDVAVALEPTLTYVPRILTQPSAASVVSGNNNYASFTVVADSEATPTYEWHESANGTSYGSALTTTGPYDVSVAGTLKITPTNTSLNNHYYRCSVINSRATTNATAVKLTVT